MGEKGEIQKSLQNAVVWRSFMMKTSVITNATYFLTLDYSTKGEDSKVTNSRHARMIGFVESRLT